MTSIWGEKGDGIDGRPHPITQDWVKPNGKIKYNWIMAYAAAALVYILRNLIKKVGYWTGRIFSLA